MTSARKVPFGEYIERAYGLKLFKGQFVTCGKEKQRGVVVGATHHVQVRLEGDKHETHWHPSDVTPMTDFG